MFGFEIGITFKKWNSALIFPGLIRMLSYLLNLMHCW